LWKSPPFEPRVEGRSLFARGASDNKGQNLAHLKAVEAYIRTGTPLPCDLTFLIEGEEEVGSKHLAGFLKKHRKDLACDAVVISDTGIPSLKHPALTYSLRGIGGEPGDGVVPVAGEAARRKRPHRDSRFLRRRGEVVGLRTEANGAIA